jgi:hypothetical protein
MIDILKSCRHFKIFEFGSQRDSSSSPAYRRLGSYGLRPSDTPPPLTRLALVNLEMNKHPDIWRFAADWSQLHHFTLEGAHEDELAQILRTFQGAIPGLREFHFKHHANLARQMQHRVYSEVLVDFISTVDALEVLSLESVSFDKLPLHVYRHAQTLREFKLHFAEHSFENDHRRELSTPQILYISRSLPRLETLTVDLDLSSTWASHVRPCPISV